VLVGLEQKFQQIAQKISKEIKTQRHRGVENDLNTEICRRPTDHREVIHRINEFFHKAQQATQVVLFVAFVFGKNKPQIFGIVGILITSVSETLA